MNALDLVLIIVAALAAACCVRLMQRLDQLHTDTLRHERAVNAERAVRILELERILDQLRAAAVGAVPASPTELIARNNAARIEVGGPKPVHVGLPEEIQRELDQIEDPIAREEFAELAQHRLSNGEAPESLAADLFTS